MTVVTQPGVWLLALLGAFVAPPRASSPTVIVEGIVFDSIATRPLGGANVQLAGVDSIVADQRFTTRSDSVGRFRFDAVPRGQYIVGFYHPSFDTLGIEPRDRPLDLRETRAPDSVRVVVAGPSVTTVSATLCGDTSTNRSLLIGHLHEAETETALANATVVARWSEARVTNGVIDVEDRVVSATTMDGGWFAVCGLPIDASVELRGVRGRDSSGVVSLRMARNDLRHLSIFVGSDVATRRTRVTGRVASSDGKPIAGAQIWVDGTERRAVTTPTGSYSLDSVPTGSQVLSVRAIGYSPKTMPVELNRAAVSIDVALDRAAVALPAVVTLGSVSYKRLETFEQHKRSAAGGGFFIKPRPPENYSSMLELHALVLGLPGTTVTKLSGAWVVIMQRRSTYLSASATVPCSPQIFLNGAQSLLEFDDLDSTIRPEDILGVEVYTRQNQIPSIYPQPINRPCGLLAVWTRAFGEGVKARP